MSLSLPFLLSVIWLQKFELMFPYLCGLQQKLDKPQEHKLMEKPFQRELMKILSPWLESKWKFSSHVKNDIAYV